MARFDPIEFLTCEVSIAAYLQEAASEEGGIKPDCITTAMLARAINQLAKETGIDRKAIYEMISNSKPDPVITAKITAFFGTPNATPAKELAHA